MITESQKHFYMETQTALAIPDEDNCMVVYHSTQTPDYVQSTVAEALGIPYHNVRVITRRVGGGFGGKVFRGTAVRTQTPGNRSVLLSLDFLQSNFYSNYL